MTQEDYDLRMGKLKEEYNENIRALNKAYAFANNPYKIGDIIEDHYHIIRIESYRFDRVYTYPSLTYIGVELTKKLEPCKRQKNTSMYQTNIKRKH